MYTVEEGLAFSTMTNLSLNSTFMHVAQPHMHPLTLHPHICTTSHAPPHTAPSHMHNLTCTPSHCILTYAQPHMHPLTLHPSHMHNLTCIPHTASLTCTTSHAPPHTASLTYAQPHMHPLTLHPHMHNLTCTPHTASSHMHNLYGHTSSSTLLQLYLTFVRPHLEYAAPVWDPHQQGLSDSLERVQKFALRMCMRDWNADYATLLQSSNLPTLASRRRYLKLCFLYQVIQGQFDFPGAPVVWRNLPLNLRNNSTFLLQRPVTYSNAHQFSFFPHTIDLWNSFPPPVHSCDSLFSFKRSLLQLNYV